MVYNNSIDIEVKNAMYKVNIDGEEIIFYVLLEFQSKVRRNLWPFLFC